MGFDPTGLPAGRRPRKLFLLGGSTTYCMQVPDDLTYASQLQQRLAAIPETRDIEVVNVGVGSAVTLQEVERLEYEIRRNNVPDFCVFFDGMNDSAQGVFNVDPGGTMAETARIYNNAVLFTTLRRMARMSVAARAIYHSIVSTHGENEPAPQPEAEQRELAKATADGYERNLLCEEICDRYQIRMIVFLQPHVYSISGRPWTPHERTAAGWMRKRYGAALQVCYPLLARNWAC